jgi:hypothetical protein
MPIVGTGSGKEPMSSSELLLHPLRRARSGSCNLQAPGPESLTPPSGNRAVAVRPSQLLLGHPRSSPGIGAVLAASGPWSRGPRLPPAPRSHGGRPAGSGPAGKEAGPAAAEAPSPKTPGPVPARAEGRPGCLSEGKGPGEEPDQVQAPGC